ncbi:tRNA 2-selenouridine(34) synthase MnmH [Desulfuribacillus stibiiarsenatis]|uniref:tRNA 2-selenouridine(34) synthase MnmH n=1 Tax=Desulfuribacillus stibiiarsenatis TaxID=1390249 RepID=A0A1E5L7K4_9FIRM|nr:tRNA 2-selenouridine(34) synthase MnmH [Desulfuribacillus stibiiarsenatis]OEH86106.1 tRNA 2-selenouridine(34) synthase MnmH [Desulfuribacillus stibiiarsenatis]
MPYIDISIEELHTISNAKIVDIRAPIEWENGALPNSINIPIFDNEERSRIGIIYKSVGPEKAQELGLEIVSAKLPAIVKEIKEISQTHTIVIYCWRGGMRSKSIAVILDLLGIPVYRICGGYRAYRKHVVNQLQSNVFQKTFIVLHGMTGVGKTVILKELQAEGYPVLNLEEFAGHRGSSFGSIGLKAPNNQKQFESLLWQRIREIGDTSYYIIEAESKRIGKVLIPDALMDAKHNGKHIYLTACIEKRVDRIIQDYQSTYTVDQLLNEIQAPISLLKKKLPLGTVECIQDAIIKKDIKTVVQALMIEYYDPRYIFKSNQYPGGFYEIDANDLDNAKQEIIKYAVQHHIFA